MFGWRMVLMVAISRFICTWAVTGIVVKRIPLGVFQRGKITVCWSTHLVKDLHGYPLTCPFLERFVDPRKRPLTKLNSYVILFVQLPFFGNKIAERIPYLRGNHLKSNAGRWTIAEGLTVLGFGLIAGTTSHYKRKLSPVDQNTRLPLANHFAVELKQRK
jgi:hypothetical protein